jgi:hypothetical protein
MNVSNVMPDSETLAWSWKTLIGAVVNVASVGNVAVPPPPATLPFTQLVSTLQLPPALPTSTSQVPLVCAFTKRGAAEAAAASSRNERRARLVTTGFFTITGISSRPGTRGRRTRAHRRAAH